MIYVPMLKTRCEELKVAKDLNYCFSDKIIPLFEILKDKYKVVYKVDPETGKYIYEQNGNSKKKIKEEPTDSHIITLDYINELIEGRAAFIDFFRFSNTKYGNNIKYDSVALSVKISQNSDLYKNRLNEVSKYDNLIPVISIKPGFNFGKNNFRNFLSGLQYSNKCIGLRITDDFLDEYKDFIEKLLRESDYLLFDIGEQNPKAKIMELKEIKEIDTKSKKILLNSPRKASISNKEFEANGITNLIDNCAKDIYSKYGFIGFGDYCGYKDSLPEDRNSNGEFTPLALIYQYANNSFYSFRAPTAKNFSGYHDVIKRILKMRSFFDPMNVCAGMEKIKNLYDEERPGGWRTWNNIIITRYIHQIYLNI